MKSKNPRVGIGVFIFKDGKFAMGKRKGAHGENSWSVPGGNLDFGETIENGAKREAKEETGMTITNVKIAGVTNDIFKKDGKHYITIWVTSDWVRGKLRVTEEDKFIEVYWCDFKKLPKSLFLPWKELQKAHFFPEIKNYMNGK